MKSTPSIRLNHLKSNTAAALVTKCCLFSTLAAVSLGMPLRSIADDAIPYVYNVENTGANFPAPPLPDLTNGSLPSVQILPDPFLPVSSYLKGDWSARDTSFADWERRRNEIMAQIEHYEIGMKPAVDMSQVTASFTNDVDQYNGHLIVTVTVGANSMTISCPVTHPSQAGTYPACIGMGSSYGSLPNGMFVARNIVGIAFPLSQVTAYGRPQNTDPFYKLYGPDLNTLNTGQYAAWSWGISRVIDGLYKLNGNLGGVQIDLSHLAVTGCSYAGKMALFSGALDERIALTVAQESGGGGANSWRYNYAETNKVEHIDNTDYHWFSADRLKPFRGPNVSYLPEDHHELDMLIAPRALYLTGNTNYTWLGNPSCTVASLAAQKGYQTLGIADRFGFDVDGNHAHCQFPDDQTNDLAYFLDKYMVGQTNLSSIHATYPSDYAGINFNKWFAGWGTTNTIQ